MRTVCIQRISSGRHASTSGTSASSQPHLPSLSAKQLGARSQMRGPAVRRHITAARAPADETAPSPSPTITDTPQSSPLSPHHQQAPPKQEEGRGDVLVEFKNVYKSFGSKAILRGASFKIRRGEAVGIIGSSGTGKSTALRLAAGLLQPDAGEVLIMGEPRRGLISDDDTSNKLKLGLVFQSGALFDSLTVKENVGFMLYEHTNMAPEAIEKRVATSLQAVGLSGVEALYPSELSGGMKKRVALARAIVTDGTDDQVEQLIMYDEPTAGLDPVASTVVEDLIRGLHVKPEGPGSGAPSGKTLGKTPSSSGYGSPGGGFFDSWSDEDAPSAPVSEGNGGTSPAAAVSVPDADESSGSGSDSDVPGKHRGISSYVVVTHQHSTIRRSVDRIIFLHAGVVVWEGSVAEFDATEEPIVRQFASGSLNGPIVYL